MTMTRTPKTGAQERPAVLWFSDIDPNALSIVGGKALNLGILTEAGFAVPPGFCVTTYAYEQAWRAAGGDSLLTELTAASDEPARLAEAAASIRERLVATPIPPDVIEAIKHAYANLSEGDPVPVAVRSSATAEDLPFASFAGQQDTYLNIVGTEAVADAVRRCWASLWTERAVAYRVQNDIPHHLVQLAVVVQSMVDARAAGVLLTANPLSGRRRQAVIDASPGLGEAVVSGAVNPDSFTVDSLTGEILSRSVGDKQVMIRSVSGGGTERVEVDADTSEACISDEQVVALAKLGRRVEDHYDAPQDIEWAIDDDDRVWLTQARPITTLFPLPADAPEPTDELRAYFSMSTFQGVYRPLTPMGMAFIRIVSSSLADRFGLRPPDILAGPPALKEPAQRIFIDVTPAFRNSIGRKALLVAMEFAEARSGAVFRMLADDPRLSATRGSRRKVARRILRTRVPKYIIRALAKPEASWQRQHRLRRELEKPFEDAARRPAAERIELIERAVFTNTARAMISAASVGAFSLGVLRRLVDKLVGDLATQDELQTLLRSLPHNPTMEMDLDLWRLTQKIQQDPTSRQAFAEHTADELAAAYAAGTLPAVLQEGLAQFLADYGFRGIAEIDIGVRKWSEDPAHLLQIMAGLLEIDDPELEPGALFIKGQRAAEEMVAELTRRARTRGRLRGKIAGFCMRRMRALAGQREMPKEHLVRQLGRAREILLSVGAEFVEAGRLEAADDVFFLDTTDVRRGLEGADLRPLVRNRRASYNEEVRRRRMPRVLLSDGTEPEVELLAASAEDGALTGTPASSGSITAKARVILDPVGAHLEHGEILVAPSTDPGWTPLFLSASGLVMEMGGVNSHGSIVAREYGIPAVVGVNAATEQITTGQLITIDGSSGVVLLQSDSDENQEDAD